MPGVGPRPDADADPIQDDNRYAKAVTVGSPIRTAKVITVITMISYRLMTSPTEEVNGGTIVIQLQIDAIAVSSLIRSNAFAVGSPIRNVALAVGSPIRRGRRSWDSGRERP
jgi:hypothetical protein